ncbi:MAG: DUF4342 domain-containing protein [Oscillospiraceae bacterium]|nr:DUF4342 domain-containing protein [Oscillospiraceae bacterium]
MDRIKELIRKGSVSRVLIKRNGNPILNFPVNAGVLGVAVGLTSAKWALLAAVLATLGFGCTVEVVKEDGSVVNVLDEEKSQKVRDLAADTVEKVKESIPVTINVDAKRDGDEIADADVEEIREEQSETND